ncbi:MAG: lipid asymmetry maintenance ABC transporter permease subunit MlaE [Gammaproteobacteria bacterium]
MKLLVLDMRDRIAGFFIDFGASQLFLFRLIAGSPSVLRRPGLLFRQVYSVGVNSLTLIMMAGFFVGMVMSLNAYHTLGRYGATASIGLVAVLSLVRELGPVVTALLFAGRAGTALTSEIGLMQTTEQLAGMEMMAVDPVKRVLVPRFLAGIIAMPLLASIFNVVGVLGAWVVAVPLLGVDTGAFWAPIQVIVDLKEDVLGGLFKSLAFGVAASLLAVFEGYHAYPTAEGVSSATTRTVVKSAMAVLILDYIITAFIVGEV